ncbi:MAG: ribonuclease D [Deltaproteobacteria bacterium CG_4_10_14_3_um_filter_60_8]|nr:MAG: ribonuclease D [Deltaproteobacteria bacterium CG_4_10_14_3_um_filter_60_8]
MPRISLGSPAMPETLLTDLPALVRFAGELSHASVIAVDLEADSMHSYQEKVCLLQFSTPGRTVLVDPLALADLSALQPVMSDPGVRKIFHAADYDIRCLFRDHGLVVRGLFDTMVCGQLLGEPKLWLADLLDRYFGVRLDKKYQRADWSLRPLSAAMLEYAAEDTRHLHGLMKLLEARLAEKGRLDWAAEEFQLLEQVRHSSSNGPLFLRAKGAQALAPRQLAVLEGLLQWRDGEAQSQDVPHFKVIDTALLIELARAMPRTLVAMRAVPGFRSWLVDRHGQELLRAITVALALPKEQWPAFPEVVRPVEDPAATARLKTLKRWRTIKAAELGMDPGVVINGTMLEAIARRPPSALVDLAGFAAMKNWQRQELGPGILAALA